MRETLVGKRYALALFQLAIEKNETEKIEEELAAIKEVFDTNGDFYAFLKSPKITRQTKKQIISEVFSGVSEWVLNTLQLMIDRNRVEHMIPMAETFIALSYDRKGISKAVVESARPLKEEEISALSKVFAEKVGKQKLEIENRVNSDLLGGVKIQIGNRIYDGTLRGKLDRLQRELIGNQL